MWSQPGGEIGTTYILSYTYQGPCAGAGGDGSVSVGNATQYTITGLQEFSVYTFTVNASIGVGSSPPASVLVNTSSAGELDDLATVDLGGGAPGHLPPSPSVQCCCSHIFQFINLKDLRSHAIHVGRIVFHLQCLELRIKVVTASFLSVFSISIGDTVSKTAMQLQLCIALPNDNYHLY